MEKLRVGFIGLGRMGGGMAGRLLEAGFPLAVFDVRPEAAGALIEAGARRAESPADIAKLSDVVCTSLPGPKEVEAAYLEPGGVLEGCRAGLIGIDFTTNAPATVREIASQLAERKAALLDAPVSGGVEGARAGTLTALVGGDEQSLETCRPVFAAVAKKVIHVGAAGDASVCKVLHNCAVFCTNMAMIECLTVGVKAGVPADVLIDVFQQSGLGRNLDLQVAMPATLFRGNFEPRFSMGLAFKDMSLATELARHCGAPMELGERCQEEMAEAMRRGWGSRDNTVFLTLREERTGVVVRQGGREMRQF